MKFIFGPKLDLERELSYDIFSKCMTVTNIINDLELNEPTSTIPLPGIDPNFKLGDISIVDILIEFLRLTKEVSYDDLFHIPDEYNEFADKYKDRLIILQSILNYLEFNSGLELISKMIADVISDLPNDQILIQLGLPIDMNPEDQKKRMDQLAWIKGLGEN